MFNLLRGEFYKLFRSKSLYICSIVMVAFTLLFYGMFSMVDMMQQGEIANGSYGIVVESDAEKIASVWEDMDILTMLQMMFATMGTIIIAIFTSIFVFGDYANGAIKNVVGKGYTRPVVFCAKYVTIVVGAVVINVITMLTVLLCEVFVLGAERLSAAVLLSVLCYTGMQLLLGSALTGIMVMISQICRNLGAGVAINVCLIMFSSFITTGMNAILTYFKVGINVSDYWILDLMSNCPLTDMDSSFLIRAVVCAIAWFAVALGVGSMHFRKADVK